MDWITKQLYRIEESRFDVWDDTISDIALVQSMVDAREQVGRFTEQEVVFSKYCEENRANPYVFMDKQTMTDYSRLWHYV